MELRDGLIEKLCNQNNILFHTGILHPWYAKEPEYSPSGGIEYRYAPSTTKSVTSEIFANPRLLIQIAEKAQLDWVTLANSTTDIERAHFGFLPVQDIAFRTFTMPVTVFDMITSRPDAFLRRIQSDISPLTRSILTTCFISDHAAAALSNARDRLEFGRLPVEVTNKLTPEVFIPERRNEWLPFIDRDETHTPIEREVLERLKYLVCETYRQRTEAGKPFLYKGKTIAEQPQAQLLVF